MTRIKNFLEKWGIHSFLLPVFFVLHNYMQYYGLVSAGVSLKLLAEILACVFLFFICMLVFTRNAGKSFQLTTLITFVILFYGDIKDMIGRTAGMPKLASYSVMLPLTGIVVFIFWMVILRKKFLFKTNLFLNVLLLIFIVADIVPLAFRQSGFLLNRNLLVKKNILSLKNLPVPAEKPDVYFLLFDCYPGTGFLRDYMHFDNSVNNAALTAKGFKVIQNPKSNYNRTAFSMASEFNFEHLKGIDNETRLRSNHYEQALLTMQTAAVPAVFKKLAYKIYNLSIFDFDNQHPLYKEHFLTQSEENVLLYNTLPGRIRADIGWNFTVGKYSNNFFRNFFAGPSRQTVSGPELQKRDFTNKVIDSIVKIPGDMGTTPKFVYAHFFLPHPPFFYNENGTSNDLSLVLKDSAYFSRALFLSYIRYTNNIMLKVIDTILHKSGHRAVIIIQSDHSSVDYESCPDDVSLTVKNFSSFYFPDRGYERLYDTMSNINTFPIVFNKYFRTTIPLQIDSATFLRY